MSEHLIYTIGHSDHSVEEFVALLQKHGVTSVLDVRSQPYSRWAHQFNREALTRDLEAAGVAYHFLGDALGGRPADPALYDAGDGPPDYRRLEQTETYQAGIARLLDLARAERVAVMCGEGEHRHCHRHLLIAQTLLERGLRVLHIQPDGCVVEGERVARQLDFWGGLA